MNLKGSKLIDFTGSFSVGTESFKQFSDEVTALIRAGSANKVAVVIDHGFGFSGSAPYLVSDHLNLTGTNPLIGPNDSCGERFPVVNDIYLTDLPGKILPTLRKAVVGGLKLGVVPTSDEEKNLRSLGAEMFSYNVTQTMIVAAHAGWKVVGIVLPTGTALDSGLMAELQALLN